jgi:hypothetical protein
MFAKTIIDSDEFLEMPLSAQALYFHLGMRADDDGFLNNARKILGIIRASDDDLKILIAKRFLIVFEGGIVVIKHWLMHNLIRQDRYKGTVYSDEKALLSVKGNGAYTISGIPNDNQVATRLTQVRLGKGSIGKEREEKSEAKASTHSESEKGKWEFFGEFQKVYLEENEYITLKDQFPKDYQRFIDSLDGYKKEHPNKRYVSDYATIKNWLRRDGIKPVVKEPVKLCPKCKARLYGGNCVNSDCDAKGENR